MLKILTVVLIVITSLHGLIHLLGFVAYWPLAKIPQLPYKTALLGERLAVGETGMRIYSVMWLVAALGFAAAAIALALGKPFWAPLMLAAALLSLVICLLDWRVAAWGAVVDIVLLLILGVVFGLRVQPDPFPAYAAPAGAVEAAPIPAGLPAPVERYYRQTGAKSRALHGGGQVPLYHSAVFTGRGSLRFMGITMPARLRFTHIAGQGYRHYMETTFYGRPILKVNEHFLDGHSRLELPFGVVENDPGVDGAANQGLWAEMSAYPSAFITDPRVRWEPIDDTNARLIVPFGASEQEFTVRFDSQSGELVHIETLRYRDEKVGALRWWGDLIRGESFNGEPGPLTFEVTWEDEGTPWLVYQVEDVVFNSDVSDYIRQKGP